MNKIMTGLVASALLVSFMIPVSAFATTSTSVENRKYTKSAVTLVSPNGGETFNVGDKFSYSATVNSSSNAKVDVYLSKDKSWKSMRAWFGKKSYHVATQDIKGSSSVQKVSGTAIVPSDIKEGKYNVVITLNNNHKKGSRDASDRKITIGRDIQVPNDPQTQVKMFSPNGGESITIGSKQIVSWSKKDSVRAVDLYLKTSDGSKKFAIAYNLAGESYVWEAGRFMELVSTNEARPVRNAFVDSGAYVMEVCEAGSRQCDSSDSYFKLSSNTSPQPTTVDADINNDGLVNVTDLLAVINAWGSCPVVSVADNVRVEATASRIKNPCTADINSDGMVNDFDLKLVIGNWSK